jgi:hypothetical protein
MLVELVVVVAQALVDAVDGIAPVALQLEQEQMPHLRIEVEVAVREVEHTQAQPFQRVAMVQAV